MFVLCVPAKVTLNSEADHTWCWVTIAQSGPVGDGGRQFICQVSRAVWGWRGFIEEDKENGGEGPQDEEKRERKSSPVKCYHYRIVPKGSKHMVPGGAQIAGTGAGGEGARENDIQVRN